MKEEINIGTAGDWGEGGWINSFIVDTFREGFIRKLSVMGCDDLSDNRIHIEH